MSKRPDRSKVGTRIAKPPRTPEERRLRERCEHMFDRLHARQRCLTQHSAADRIDIHLEAELNHFAAAGTNHFHSEFLSQALRWRCVGIACVLRGQCGPRVDWATRRLGRIESVKQVLHL